MKWTHATALLTTLGLFGVGSVWSGCGGGDNTTGDGGPDATNSDTGTGNDTGTGSDSGGGDTGTGTDSGDGGTTNLDASVIDCANYCTNIATVCTGNDNQYLDNATCLAMCATWMDGDAGALTGNTLACRLAHLALAIQTPATECPHAGPYGFGGCGSENEDFCLLYAALCGTYGNGQCPQSFGNLASGDAGDFLSGSGNTKQCREYHLENAYQADGGGGHCSHAGQTGGGICQ